MITNQRQFPFKREFFINMRWIFASEVCSRISLIFFCTYTCKTLNFLKFTVPPSSTDIQLIYNVSVRQNVQWKKGYWLVLKFHKETYIIVSCTVDVIFTHVIGMKRSPYIYFLKTWAKFNADIFVRVQRWAIYWFLKCKALEI